LITGGGSLMNQNGAPIGSHEWTERTRDGHAACHGGVEGWRSGETGDVKKNAGLGEVSADASALGATVLIPAI
jgi:hypothetical protein